MEGIEGGSSRKYEKGPIRRELTGPVTSFLSSFLCPQRDTAENAPLLTNHYHFHVFFFYSYVLPGPYPCSFDDHRLPVLPTDVLKWGLFMFIMATARLDLHSGHS